MDSGGNSMAEEFGRRFGKDAAAVLARIVNPGFAGVIGAEDWQELIRGRDEDDILLHLLPLAARLAVTPVSGFAVGALVLGASGKVYAGANLEFSRLTAGSTLHAEQAALIAARNGGEKALRCLAVDAAPCGHCRQFLMEADDQGAMKVLFPGVSTTLAGLYPHPFGPAQLQISAGLLASASSPPTGADLPALARFAADNCWSPYSGHRLGVALQTGDGRLFSGSLMENAAFNPGVQPATAALSALTLAGGSPGDVTGIFMSAAACLPEPVLQANRQILGSVTPAPVQEE